MKALVAFVCITLISVSQQLNLHQMIDDLVDIVDEDAKECYNIFHLNHEKFDEWLQHDILSEDRLFKCFLSCVFTHLKVIDESGTSLTTNLKKYLEVDEAKQDYIFNLCKNLTGNDDCEKTFNMTRMILKMWLIREKAVIGLSKATVHVTTTMGSVNLEYFFWSAIDNGNGSYCGTAPNVSVIHER
ncbi:hypothetical protein FQA39_LY13767 [Lamprigera yunnana]|nr:hypothetical protein FQA39_LY13767 [Lamprigera yunnana]